jgi:hypothetical protein
MDEFAIITAASSNHFHENICMLKNLLAVNYDGPLIIYVMRSPHEKGNKDLQNYVTQVKNSPFTQVEVIEVESPYAKFYTSYCWKPAVIAETVSRFKNKLKVFY